MSFYAPYRQANFGMGFVAEAVATGSAAGPAGTIITGVVSLAFTIFSGIAAKNQAIIDGLVAEKNQIKAAQDEMRSELGKLRQMRDGLMAEKIWLLGDRARGTGMGLLKSRQVKKEIVRLDYQEELLQSMVDQAEVFNQEIGILAGEVQALRSELGIREDEPLTQLEAAMKSGQINKKYIFIALGVFALVAIVGVISKRNKKTLLS